MEKIIEIPEGYEARIEGNKVVLEPKESEDEGIRKGLLHHFRNKTKPYWNEIAVKDIIAYLEKQKEPEWCHHKVDLSGCSEEYMKAYYDGWNNCNQQHAQREAEQKPVNFHPVFRVGDYIRNKRTGDKVLIEQIDVEFKCYYYVSSDGVAEDHSDLSWAEQDNWELIGQEIEQKPAEWSEEDWRMLCDIAGYIAGTGSSSGITKQERVDFLYGLPKRFNLQPKEEWSEKDEAAFGDLMWCVEQAKKSAKDENDMGNIWFAENWVKNRLKSIRLQPKQEWSEEVAKRLDNIAGYLQYVGFEDDADFIKSLRPQPHTLSIKDATKFGNLQYEREVKDGIQSEKSRQWKPSEEQMRVLRDVITMKKGNEYETIALRVLYNDLEKLK